MKTTIQYINFIRWRLGLLWVFFVITFTHAYTQVEVSNKQRAPEQRHQLSEAAIIEQIDIQGTKKTRRATILRELEFTVGDTLSKSEIRQALDRNRLRIMNLGIFSHSELSFSSSTTPNGVIIHIQVTEGWYVLPVPLLSLADRNFNVWWREFDHSFKRLNYGLDWTQLNVTGRADALKAKAQFGYTNRYELSYRLPGINRKRTIGFETSISYSRGHELSFNTAQNKLQ
ncbi:MAG: hypothetical protein JNJ57_12425, partial [Saprospiraceae bacterium]|nr:hypothetical protein [Saprospiraceae bacterium]